MGITIQKWRCKIGCFNQPNKCKNHLNVIVVHINKRFKHGLRVAICLAAILIVCGDVEQNPGPPKSIADRTRKGTPSRAQVTTSATNDSSSNSGGVSVFIKRSLAKLNIFQRVF